ncbi:HNHc domain containing protein [uncultured Caudovirales phage]|uniref:HNHc domain containing protein n=1 Tax=uncultured Caudovirales phage TaxID=2100421 RepID=A0A6J5T328_9CAUD|nr:HNHc domain containing protein [uncultured Caudovirales phage]
MLQPSTKGDRKRYKSSTDALKDGQHTRLQMPQHHHRSRVIMERTSCKQNRRLRTTPTTHAHTHITTNQSMAIRRPLSAPMDDHLHTHTLRLTMPSPSHTHHPRLVLMTTRKGDIRGKAQWKAIRLTILARDNHTCTYCGTYPANTIDHIQPLAHGGDPYNQDNLTTACTSCNSHKGDRTSMRSFPDSTSTSPLAQGRYFSRGNELDSVGNGRDLTVNVLGSVPFE